MNCLLFEDLCLFRYQDVILQLHLFPPFSPAFVNICYRKVSSSRRDPGARVKIFSCLRNEFSLSVQLLANLINRNWGSSVLSCLAGAMTLNSHLGRGENFLNLPPTFAEIW